MLLTIHAHRENIRRDNHWNQGLREHVPDLFVSSLQHFLALEVPQGAWRHHWLDWWLKAVPLDGEAEVSQEVDSTELPRPPC